MFFGKKKGSGPVEPDRTGEARSQQPNQATLDKH